MENKDSPPRPNKAGPIPVSPCYLSPRMFGFFRKRQRGSPQKRELYGLMSCIVGWRRAVLEAHYRDGAADAKALNERRDALAWYAHGVGGVGPFTQQILHVPIGELAESLFLEGLYRIETAASIAWALGLVETVPPTTEGANFEVLSELFPTEGAPPPSIRDAKLRERAEILTKRDEWKAEAASARAARDDSPGETTGIQFSRAYERARGLSWICSDVPWIEDTV